MALFAKHISCDRDFCSYWEITTRGEPTPVDYTSDRDFWYNLPANFDISDASNHLYDLTGEQDYLLDPVMANFHRMTVEDYLWTWDRDGDGIVDRVESDGRRGIASYDEGNTKGYCTAADALSLEYAAFMAAARMYTLKGETEKAQKMQAKALHLQHVFCQEWWQEEEGHFASFLLKDGHLSDNISVDNLIAPLRCRIIDDPEKLARHLDFVITQEPQMNVEVRSYLPLILWQHGRAEDAMRVWLKMTDNGYPRREYPEVSFAAIESLIMGYMGIHADAACGTLTTCSNVSDGQWAKICDFPLWGGRIHLKHEGRRASELTNKTGRPLVWKAFIGDTCVEKQVLPGQTIRLE